MRTYALKNFRFFRGYNFSLRIHFLEGHVSLNAFINFIDMNKGVTQGSWHIWINLSYYKLCIICCRLCTFHTNTKTAESIFVRWGYMDEGNINWQYFFI